MGAVTARCTKKAVKKKKDDGKLDAKLDDLDDIIDNPGRIQEFYDLERHRMGEGSFGTVFKGVNKSTGFERAIKVMSKKYKKNLKGFHNEIHIMKNVDHPNIIKFYEAFQDKKYIYVVMQLCKGKELFELIKKVGHLSETQTGVLMSQIFRAITYMHAAGVCHRDLKTENFMLLRDDGPIEENTVNIIDFGLAAMYETNDAGEPLEALTCRVGSPYFIAPQVLAGSYDNRADVWSCGAVMYTMLCGYPPFYGESDADVLAKVRLGNYQFNQADWKSISNEAKDVVRGLLKINPQERIGTHEALKSPWLKKVAPVSTELPMKNTLVNSLRQFASANKLKKAALYVIAGNLTDEELKPAVASFNAMDLEGDGSLGYAEVYGGLLASGIKDIPPDLKKIMADMDSDGSGAIEFTEFLSATIDRKYITQDNVWSAFRVFDQNGDGKISQTEMYRILNARGDEGVESSTVTPQEIIALMKELSSDGDSYVDFEEFYQMMRNNIKPEHHHRHKSTHRASADAGEKASLMEEHG